MMSVIMLMSPVNASAKEMNWRSIKRSKPMTAGEPQRWVTPSGCTSSPRLEGSHDVTGQLRMLEEPGRPQKTLKRLWVYFNLKPIRSDRRGAIPLSVRACVWFLVSATCRCPLRCGSAWLALRTGQMSCTLKVASSLFC